MKRNVLAQRLDSEGFRRDAYSLDGNTPAYDGLVLKNIHGTWYVEYYERGNTDILGIFGSEDEACEYLYQQICRDISAKQTNNSIADKG